MTESSTLSFLFHTVEAESNSYLAQWDPLHGVRNSRHCTDSTAQGLVNYNVVSSLLAVYNGDFLVLCPFLGLAVDSGHNDQGAQRELANLSV